MNLKTIVKKMNKSSGEVSVSLDTRSAYPDVSMVTYKLEETSTFETNNLKWAGSGPVLVMGMLYIIFVVRLITQSCSCKVLLKVSELGSHASFLSCNFMVNVLFEE